MKPMLLLFAFCAAIQAQPPLPMIPIRDGLSFQAYGVDESNSFRVDSRFTIIIWSDTAKNQIFHVLRPEYCLIATLTDTNGNEIPSTLFPNKAINYSNFTRQVIEKTGMTDPIDIEGQFISKYCRRGVAKVSKRWPLQFGYTFQINKVFHITNNGPFALTIRVQGLMWLPKIGATIVVSQPETFKVEGTYESHLMPVVEPIASTTHFQITAKKWKQWVGPVPTEVFDADDSISVSIKDMPTGLPPIIWLTKAPYVLSMTDSSGQEVETTAFAKNIESPFTFQAAYSAPLGTKPLVLMPRLPHWIDQMLVPSQLFEMKEKGRYTMNVRVWGWIAETNALTPPAKQASFTAISDPLVISVVKK